MVQFIGNKSNTGSVYLTGWGWFGLPEAYVKVNQCN